MIKWITTDGLKFFIPNESIQLQDVVSVNPELRFIFLYPPFCKDQRGPVILFVNISIYSQIGIVK